MAPARPRPAPRGAARGLGGADACGREEVEEEVDALEGLRHLQLAVYGVEHRTEAMFADDWHEDMTGVLERLARHLG